MLFWPNAAGVNFTHILIWQSRSGRPNKLVFSAPSKVKMMICDKINKFCFVCGEQFAQTKFVNITSTLCAIYLNLFGGYVLKEPYAPPKCCKSCESRLHKQIKWLSAPMLWEDPGEHDGNTCYFCVNHRAGMLPKISTFTYTETPFAARPVQLQPGNGK